MKIKQITLPSGRRGWQGKLRDVYASVADLGNYDVNYGICSRLGYDDPDAAWEANPLIQGSTNPPDFKKVLTK